MTRETKKSFERIRDDYTFFAAHTNEFAQDLATYQQALQSWHPPENNVQFLDFGCGDGEFTSRFLDLVGLPPERLAITLVEPDASYRRQAVQRLLPYSHLPITHDPQLPTDLAPSFHLILCNHVLYYVPDLRQTLRQLLQARHSQGLFLAAMAGRENILCQMWQVGFGWLGQKVPYYLAEDLQALLAEFHPVYQQVRVAYNVHFPDTTEHRCTLLRFLFGEYFSQLPLTQALALFDPYAAQGQVHFTTYHDQFWLGPHQSLTRADELLSQARELGDNANSL